MAITGLTLSATKDVTSQYDPATDENYKTVFTIGAIDLFISSYVFDRVLDFKRGEDNTVQSAAVRMNEMDVELVRFGLKTIKNFVAEDGEDIPFTTTTKVVLGKSYSVASDDVMTRLPIDVIRELAPQIRELNTVTKDDAKN